MSGKNKMIQASPNVPIETVIGDGSRPLLYSKIQTNDTTKELLKDFQRIIPDVLTSQKSALLASSSSICFISRIRRLIPLLTFFPQICIFCLSWFALAYWYFKSVSCAAVCKMKSIVLLRRMKKLIPK